jgi:hypothetical protein
MNAVIGVIYYPSRIMEERGLLILGQQEHEQLLDEEILQLKGLLQAKEKELQRLHSILKSTPQQQQQHQQQQHQQQQQHNWHQPRAEMDIVDRLESLEQEMVQLKRRTPTLAEHKCARPACAACCPS